MADTPAFVTNSRSDILAINPLGRALFDPMCASATRPVNAARFLFLDPTSHDFWPDRDRIANGTVAAPRTAAGRDSYDCDLSELIGELSTRSEEFRHRWAAQNVCLHTTGTKRLHHPEVGGLTLAFEVLALAADHDQQLVAYTAQPDSPHTTRSDYSPASSPRPPTNRTNPPPRPAVQHGQTTTSAE